MIFYAIIISTTKTKGMILRKPSEEEVEKVKQSQIEKEKSGRFVCVDASTLVFVKDGQNINTVIARFLNKRQERGVKSYVSMGF